MVKASFEFWVVWLMLSNQGVNLSMIKLNGTYKSIESLESTDLPDFVVLVGRNGTGKTQILEALNEGLAEVPGIEKEEVAMYNAASFAMASPGQGSRHSDPFAREIAALFFDPRADTPFVARAKGFFDQLAKAHQESGGEEAHQNFEEEARRHIIQHLPNFPTHGDFHLGNEYVTTVYQGVLQQLDATRHRNGRVLEPQRKAGLHNGNAASLVGTAAKLSRKLFHELTEDDLLRASRFEGDLLRNAISEVFTTYKLEQVASIYRQFETSGEPMNFAELASAYEAEHRPPWNTLRDLLMEMREASTDEGTFNFEFSDPSTITIGIDEYDGFTFTTEMTNLATGAQYDPSSLSSGEKILMALCLASFNRYLGRRSPKLLLLDELDSVLHPSMIAALVTALKSAFVERGTRIIMTSHSPVAVAALDAADIYKVERNGGHVGVFPAEKNDAIVELSEGLATVDTGLKIATFRNSGVTILTEGNNTKHLRRWVELFFPNGEVSVFEGLEAYTGKSELVLYGRMLAMINASSHFLLVWDCDAEKEANSLASELPPGANITAFALSKRADTIIAKGIENNYDQDLLMSYVNKTTGPDEEVIGYTISQQRKKDFAAYISEHGTVSDFAHFEGLRAAVSEILHAA